MDEQEITKIENEILEKVEKQVEGMDSERAKKIIEGEVKNRGYLKEDWHIWGATERIKEMIDENNTKKYKPEKLKPAGKLLVISLMIVGFFGMLLSFNIDNAVLKGGLLFGSFSLIVYPIKMWWDSLISKG